MLSSLYIYNGVFVISCFCVGLQLTFCGFYDVYFGLFYGL